VPPLPNTHHAASGFFVSPTGMLRAIAREAQSIAAAIRTKA
jgi:hypothetical protein